MSTEVGRRARRGSHLALQDVGLFAAYDLRSVPGVAANTSQPVHVVFVEDLGRHRMTKAKSPQKDKPQQRCGLMSHHEYVT